MRRKQNNLKTICFTIASPKKIIKRENFVQKVCAIYDTFINHRVYDTFINHREERLNSLQTLMSESIKQFLLFENVEWIETPVSENVKAQLCEDCSTSPTKIRLNREKSIV